MSYPTLFVIARILECKEFLQLALFTKYYFIPDMLLQNNTKTVSQLHNYLYVNNFYKFRDLCEQSGTSIQALQMNNTAISTNCHL